MEAAYPTSWNTHVINCNNINDHNYKDTLITVSRKYVNEQREKSDDMNIYLSPTKTSSTIEIGKICNIYILIFNLIYNLYIYHLYIINNII